MAEALRLAWRGLHSTDPNPRVGCVLVRDGAVVGRGWHQRAGEPHAEVYALREAGVAARGATAYVTLEPCSHHGRTPPCAEGLIAAGVGRVVAAMVDPNPLVAGQGLARLRQAGIPAESGLLAGQAEALNPGFCKRMRSGLPWVRVKLAQSLDGRTAMASGESQWITAPAARADVQRLRARSSAILTGIGTLLADDPSLNVRLEGAWRQPLRVVLDSALRTPPTARLLGLPGSTLILTASGDSTRAAALATAGAELRQVATVSAGGLDLQAVLRLLGERQCNEVHVEAGATLSGALVAAGLVDELVVYVAPLLLGDGARGLLHLPGLQCMAEGIRLAVTDLREVGRDIRITARPLAATEER